MKEIKSLNDGLFSIDFEEVSVEALERRFELSVAVMFACEPCGVNCSSSVCEHVCEPVCTQIIANLT